MQRSFSQSCLWAICLSILCTPILFAQSKQRPAQRWEYMTVQVCNRQKEVLDKYGDDGWEIVSVFGESSGGCGDYTFKRLKSANAPKYIDPNERPKLPANAPTCDLTFAQAPTIRGLRLGMTVDELLDLFPGANPNDLKGKVEQAKSFGSFGQMDYSFPGAQHKDRIERFIFNVVLFDGRVKMLRVYYPFQNSTGYGMAFNREQMIDVLRDAFNLPGRDLWTDYNSALVLKCKGFTFESWYENRIYLTVTDTATNYDEIIEQRREAEFSKRRAEFKP